MPTARTPEHPRWTRSAAKIALLQELHSLTLDVGLRSNAVKPVPEQWERYFEDLRRGRLSIGSAMARFFDTIELRDMGVEGRAIGTKAMAILQQYLDLCAPPVAGPIEASRPVLLPRTHQPTRVRAVRFAKRTGTDD